jgi:signal transduction histidine kinase
VSVARTREDPLPPTAERRLFDFAELLAQAIANAEARAELAASRARIVQAGDEARRRIERNLHDGAQQRLVALSLTLRMAQNALGDDPRAAMLARASEEAQLTLQDLRELARGIHPAVLSERGLAAALEAVASRSPVPVELDVADERLPAPVEATAYYVVAECLANVAKYAGECTVDVTVAREGDALRVEVRDDGCGGAEVGAGTGLRGLTDRVEALHGTLHVGSHRGDGTVVSAVIPL